MAISAGVGGMSVGTAASAEAASREDRAFASTLKEGLLASDKTVRAQAAQKLSGHPSFRRERLSADLHALDLFAPLPAGRRELVVPVGGGEQRAVALRIPRGYRPDRAWPMIYLLHPSGGNGPSFLGFIEQALGPKVEEFVVAAPSYYRQTGLDAPAPFTTDHPSILEAVRRTAHIDADRSYVVGYSLGGYATWAVALLHGDLVGGAVAIGSVFTVPPDGDGLWKDLLPNFRHVPLMHLWGAKDTVPVTGFGGFPRTIGVMSEINERFRQLTRGISLPQLQDVRVPNKGHGGLQPPTAAFHAILAGRRVHAPKTVDHTFRHVFQGSTYWLEAREWVGEHWGPGFPNIVPKRGETQIQAKGRVIRERLARLQGQVQGQTIAITRRHVGAMVVWFPEGLIDWAKPVRIEVDGKLAFEGKVTPSLDFALAEAQRTYDFDRLRWAGVAIDREGVGSVMD